MLLATMVRGHLLFRPNLHADEALYARWSRLIASGQDFFLQQPHVDKPPILFYIQAIFFRFLGTDPFAVRWTGFIAALLLVPLMAQWVRSLWHDEKSALCAACLTAIAPYSRYYSTTGFTDPLMVMLGVSAFVLQARNRPMLSGIFLGLAMGTKYSALLYGGVLVGIAFYLRWTPRQWGRFLLGAFSILLPLLIWITATQRDSLATTGDVRLLEGLRLITAQELIPRTRFWLEYGSAVIGLPALIIALMFAKKYTFSPYFTPTRLILAVSILYFLALILIAFPLYARYLLILLPFLAVIIGRILPKTHLTTLILLSTLAFPIPTLENVADTVGIGRYLATAPYGTVLYDHHHSWEWNYHFFDKGVYVAWVADPAALLTDLAAFYDDQRYLTLPNDSAESTPYLTALSQAGYQLIKKVATTDVTLYKIAR